MNMPSIKIAATVAFLAAATSVAAFPYPGSDRFTDAKSGFRVEVSHEGAAMILVGRQPVTHETFKVAVVGNRVTGVWAGRAVDWTLTKDGRGAVASVVDASVYASR